MKTILKPAVAAAACLFVAHVASSPASATSITFDLDTTFSGSAPAGGSPWATATFDDAFGGSETVRLTMSASGLTGSEFISGWYFNFDTPALDPLALTVVEVDVTAVSATNVFLGTDLFMADGDGSFDILFDFPPPPGNFASKFSGGESVIYDLTYTSAITALSFNFLSAGGGNSPSGLPTAAHVQGGPASG